VANANGYQSASHLTAKPRAVIKKTAPQPIKTAICGHKSPAGKSRQKTLSYPSSAQALKVQSPASRSDSFIT
jgi:hypothetical protein